ncbi:MAG: DUF4136 domain-containing protein [Cyclobacteriaceae bacterium]|nr:DUF4136 domain-containing protein [Cyclobacteriaceae bacterium]
MKTIISLLLLITFSSCATYINYQVSTLKDPSLDAIKMDSPKYALRKDSLQKDKLLELNLFKIIKTELDNKGWTETDIKNADYIFELKFDMESGRVTGSQTILVYDPKAGKNVPQQRAYTSTVYKRNVIINLFDKQSDAQIWSADCISEGSTNNVYLPSTYMLPFAISVLPEQGNWTKKALVKK